MRFGKVTAWQSAISGIMTCTKDECRRQEYIRLVSSFSPTHFITFNFGYRVKDMDSREPMRKFFNRLQSATYGRKWSKRLDYTFPLAFGFFEHPDSNPHFHVLATLDERLSRTILLYGDDIWRDLVTRGQLDSGPIRDPVHSVTYATKRLATQLRFDEVFIYSDTRRAKVAQNALGEKISREIMDAIGLTNSDFQRYRGKPPPPT